MLEFSIATITIFVGVLNQGVKYLASTYLKKDIKKYIPILSVVFGIALSLAGYYVKDVEMGNNIIEAIFIGISAGAASTGVHQIYKQNTNTSTTEENTEEEITVVEEENEIEENTCVEEEN